MCWNASKICCIIYVFVSIVIINLILFVMLWFTSEVAGVNRACPIHFFCNAYGKTLLRSIIWRFLFMWSANYLGEIRKSNFKEQAKSVIIEFSMWAPQNPANMINNHVEQLYNVLSSFYNNKSTLIPVFMTMQSDVLQLRSITLTGSAGPRASSEGCYSVLWCLLLKPSWLSLLRAVVCSYVHACSICTLIAAVNVLKAPGSLRAVYESCGMKLYREVLFHGSMSLKINNPVIKCIKTTTTWLLAWGFIPGWV